MLLAEGFIIWARKGFKHVSCTSGDARVLANVFRPAGLVTNVLGVDVTGVAR